MLAFNRTRGKPVADRVKKADNALTRMIGLLNRSGLESGEGLWILPCPMIHTFFMRFAIDVVFLNKEGKAVCIERAIAPWRMSRWVRDAHSVLELPAGAAEGAVAVGDVLEFRGY